MASIGQNVQNHIESSIYMSNSAFYDQMKLNSFELCFELCTGCFELCIGWPIKRVMVDFGGLNFYNCPNSFVCIVMINSVFKKMMPRLYIFSSSFYTYRVAQKKRHIVDLISFVRVLKLWTVYLRKWWQDYIFRWVTFTCIGWPRKKTHCRF